MQTYQKKSAACQYIFINYTNLLCCLRNPTKENAIEKLDTYTEIKHAPNFGQTHKHTEWMWGFGCCCCWCYCEIQSVKSVETLHNTRLKMWPFPFLFFSEYCSLFRCNQISYSWGNFIRNLLGVASFDRMVVVEKTKQQKHTFAKQSQAKSIQCKNVNHHIHWRPKHTHRMFLNAWVAKHVAVSTLPANNSLSSLNGMLHEITLKI